MSHQTPPGQPPRYGGPGTPGGPPPYGREPYGGQPYGQQQYGQPPYGGQQPYGAPPPNPKRAPIPIRRGGQVEERSPVAVAVLSFVTCGIYFLYWLGTTSRELKDTLEDQEIKPGVDVFLTLLTCGIWSIYALYRNAQKIHGALLSIDPYARDQSELVLILGLASVFTGYVTWVISVYVIQEELNKLGRA